MRYPEIHKNYLNHVNFSIFDLHRTNIIQHNNQPTYKSNNDGDFEYGIISMSDILYFVVLVHIK